jgi:hypothetical protein
MRRLLVLMMCAAAIAAPPASAIAEVNVERMGSENPMKEVTTSIIYGAAAGLILGGAVALVDDSGDDDHQIKMGFALGAFFGCGFGLFHVLTRPKASAMIEIHDGRAHLALATPTMDRRGELKLALVRAKF